MRLIVCLMVLLEIGCSATSQTDFGPDRNSNDGGFTTCGSTQCSSGFHCEFDACVANSPASTQTTLGDPVSGAQFLFLLERPEKRILRIDTQSLEVRVFPTGLAPMDLQLVADRGLSVTLDALDLVQIGDHRAEPPLVAALDTATALSHLTLSPTGEFAIAYYDWDDAGSHARQGQPGNINQISVIDLQDHAQPLSSHDNRVVNLHVGFLPRAVHFSADGHVAVVIAQHTLNIISLAPDAQPIASLVRSIEIQNDASEVLVNGDATFAVIRYADASTLDVVPFDGGATGCFQSSNPITDVAWAGDNQLWVLASTIPSSLTFVDVATATVPCVTLSSTLPLPQATQLAIDPTGQRGIAYTPNLVVEDVYLVDLAGLSSSLIHLEKAVGGVAFSQDGRFVLFSHIKAPGSPVWDPSVEDPEVSVDKSFGATYFDTQSLNQRLVIDDQPFGPFNFVASSPAAIYQAVLDSAQPHLLRINLEFDFGDDRIDLAAPVEHLGFVSPSHSTYVTQKHPWGRITFIDHTNLNLRHLTGFALEAR